MGALAQRDRIQGLDFWRALLMLFGICYHGVMLRPDLVAFRTVTIVSNSSRMGLFFAISGMVAAMAMTRHDPRAWLRRRLASIGVPTLFGLLVICPLTALALQLAPAAIRLPTSFPEWYHIWFLVALLLYTPFGYGMHLLDERWRVFDRLAADARLLRHFQALVLLILPVVMFALMQAIMMAVTRTTPVTIWHVLLQLRPTAGYLPMFLLGFALGRSPGLRLAMTARLALPVAVIVATAAAHLLWFGALAGRVPPGERDWMEAVLLLAGTAVLPPALLVPVIRAAFAIRTLPVPLRRLSDASFTVYLVHFPIVLALNGLFAWVAWNEYAEYVVAVLATLLLSYAIHARIVRRSPLAALLLNGVVPRRGPVLPVSLEPPAIA